ncbi:MAG TPA: copper-binding protein [Thermoanaerobaculia bacterium]|nr:copper-binding protein [Thermoanaerobaculia bacterium]
MKRYNACATLLCLLLLCASLAAGCSAGDARDFQVRGRVAQLPTANDPASQFMIQHEAVDSFVDRQGKVVGMDSMTMPFPLASGVSLAGLAVGDPVAFTLRVHWGGTPPIRITELHKLPAGTPIVFREAHPPRS